MTMRGSFRTLDGCEIAYWVDGSADAPALLLSNSLGATHKMWDDQVPVFAKHWRTVTYDTRGHGASAAPAGAYSLDRLGRDALDLLDHLQIGKTHFCGISLGGMTGQWLGAHAPTRVDRLILAHTSAYLPPAAAWQERIETVLKNGVCSIAEAVVGRWVSPAFKDNHPDKFTELVEAVAKIDAAGYSGCCAAIRDMDQRPLLSAINAPSLILAGLCDQATPLAHSQLLVDAMPNAKLATTDGAHLSNLEYVDQFNNLVLKHVLMN
ncbi:MAG: 3-oxoadipate enol-lactonase [Sphingomonadaceae bacterium PASS1]|nr:MAG: 3-oxoadipate enol-lactonase [Sphingomonadaceae bacterium PASS1]